MIASCFDRYARSPAILAFSLLRLVMMASRFVTWLFVRRWTSCCLLIVISFSAISCFKFSHQSFTL